MTVRAAESIAALPPSERTAFAGRWWIPTLHLTLVLGAMVYVVTVTHSPWCVAPLCAVAVVALGWRGPLPSIEVSAKNAAPNRE